MSFNQYIGFGTADGRIHQGGVEWQVEVDFYVNESDLEIEATRYVGYYVNDELQYMEPIPFDVNEYDERSYTLIESMISLWLSENGYEA